MNSAAARIARGILITLIQFSNKGFCFLHVATDAHSGNIHGAQLLSAYLAQFRRLIISCSLRIAHILTTFRPENRIGGNVESLT